MPFYMHVGDGLIGRHSGIGLSVHTRWTATRWCPALDLPVFAPQCALADEVATTVH
jgi:hypothetical protein